MKRGIRNAKEKIRLAFISPNEMISPDENAPVASQTRRNIVRATGNARAC